MSLPVILIAFSALPSFAATYIGSSGSYATGTNWDTGTVPALATANNSVTIANGTTVDYNGATLSDMIINNGNTLKVSGGSTLSTTTTHWAQVNNGTFTIDGGTYTRTSFGTLSAGQAAGVAGSPVTATINLLNGGKINMPDTGSTKIVLGNASYTTSTMNLTDSSVFVGSEFWLGGNGASDLNEIVQLNLNNSSITTTGAVGMWIWDYADSGNSMKINFNGPAGSYINVSDSIGTRDKGTGGTTNNATTWESLWGLGILTANGGRSGLTGDSFSTYFTTSGTAARDTTPVAYRLTYVPEPSGTLLAGLPLGLLLLVNRRRNRALAR